MKVGDLVKLHPQEAILLPVWQRSRLGIIVDVYESKHGTDLHVLWSGDTESDFEYEDGVVVVSKA
jgi:hypothetical protein